MTRLGVLRILGLFVLLQAAAICVASGEEDQSSETPVALMRVQLPISGNADQILVTRLERVRDRLSAAASAQKSDRRPLLIIELAPRPGATVAGEGSSFERAFTVASFLGSGEMRSVKTVAFVPRTIRGHGALLALACEEVVMSPDALLSAVDTGKPDGLAVGKTTIVGYQEIAQTSMTIPMQMATALADPQVELLQVETEAGIEFLLRSELEEFAAGHEIVEQKTLVPAGTPAEFDGREWRQFGFVKYLASTPEAVAKAYGIAVETLEEEDALSNEWTPVLIDVQGEITPQTTGQLQSLLGRSLESGEVNWVGVRIDSAGGDLESCLQLANALAKLDANSVRTVAYVPSEAVGGAAVVALACDQLVMHPEARLEAGDQEIAPDVRDALEVSLRESLAPRTRHSWSLLESMIDPQVELLEYQNKTTGQKRVMSAEEMAALPDSVDWQRPQPVGDGKGPLAFTGEDALAMDLAWRNVDSFDELQDAFQLQIEPVVLKPNWALELVEALASPEFSIILIMVGFAGLYIELRTAGLGVGGFIATVALVLFFWSKFLNGTAGWLEVLLFALGLAFILLEVFVLPGFGIFGLGGGALIIASLVLASLTFVAPHSTSEVKELVGSMGSVVIAGVGVLVLAVLSNYLLPQVPGFRKMVLAPPPPEERAFMEKNEAVVDYSNLIGTEGVATTHLRPAGKAEIDHQLIDVIAEGVPLDAGTPIVVVDAKGNRVIVRGLEKA